jgi:hypothetical protein
MGLSKSKHSLHILVIGVQGAGKTHFLDMFYFGNDSTKIPTRGFHETVVHQPYCKREIRLTEYGSHISHAAVLKAHKHHFDAIYLVVRSNATEEELMESNNALLLMCDLLPEAAVGIVWNVCSTDNGFRALKWTPRTHRTCVCHADFSKSEWSERASELFEWTIANCAKK